ncbi:MAG: hypothetical protein JWO50_215 [Candidatus Kaiserbacteria bacterium]|nr:hypothetical protein [Candidatus Kaiserbacteria bacterium]
MRNRSQARSHKHAEVTLFSRNIFGTLLVTFALIVVALFFIWYFTRTPSLQFDRHVLAATSSSSTTANMPLSLDKIAYDKKMFQLANYAPVRTTASSSTTKGMGTSTSIVNYMPLLSQDAAFTATSTNPKQIWPPKTMYPNYGAILPSHRVIAYYGNFYSKGMGVLGEYSEDIVLAKLQKEIAAWNKADPTTPVLPAIDYIAVTAQGSAGRDGKYRARMPDSQIDHAIEMANKINGIVILDVQVGLSTPEIEVPLLEKYLKMPNVHLALDPEFEMHNGEKPGSVVGVTDAKDINFVAQYLAKLVRDNNLPPKILIVHRFKSYMVTSVSKIKPLPEVQIVMDMDGWGSPERKIDTYQYCIVPQPVQFAGFKIFYKNDLRAPSTRLLTPADVLKLQPQPIFIQYQ